MAGWREGRRRVELDPLRRDADPAFRVFAEAPTGAFSLNVLYDHAIEAGKLLGVVHRGGWCHVGTRRTCRSPRHFYADPGIPDEPSAYGQLGRPVQSPPSRACTSTPSAAREGRGERGRRRRNLKVYSIPPGLPFVDALAAGMLQGLGKAPEDLATAQVFLPTRRACRALPLAFVRRSAGRPLLLPKLTPLGDIDEDDLAFEDIEADASAGCDIPPAIPALRRQLLLAQQVARHLAPAPSPAQAAQLAAELARLFDQVHTERLDFRDLDCLVPDEFARHWQITLGFLRPIAQWWKERLAAEGCIEPADRRDRLLDRRRQPLGGLARLRRRSSRRARPAACRRPPTC